MLDSTYPHDAGYSRHDGIKVYSKVGLHFYDPLIMGAVTRYVWDCPAEIFVAYYCQYATENHADVGVGTGYCLDHCGFVVGKTRLALIDPQVNCLEYAALRLARFNPEKYLWQTDQSLSNIPPFHSIGLGGVLHCMPGEMHEKASIFDSLKQLCTPRTTIFGYTLVNDSVHTRFRRRFVFDRFHQAQIINCKHDSVATLERALASRFDHYSVSQVGCFAFFNGTSAY
jgi:hypothetical protein